MSEGRRIVDILSWHMCASPPSPSLFFICLSLAHTTCTLKPPTYGLSCIHISNRTLHLRTEMGLLTVAPHEIVVLPRGIRFQVELEGPSRGYVLEVFQGHFQVRLEEQTRSV